MSDVVTRMQNPPVSYVAGLRTNWGAIWGGVFTFAAIFAVFEALAMAIFPSSTSSGFEVWSVVLTFIAMYVAGVETGRLAGVANRHDGLVHGIMMFGLTAVSAVILSTLTTSVAMAGTAVGRVSYALNLAPGTEWALFAGLFLGWIAAMGGASSGVARRTRVVSRPVEAPIEMRPAA